MVEDEEFVFRTKVCRISDTDLFGMLECFFCDGSWASFIKLTFIDIIDVTEYDDRRISRERIEECCGNIRFKDHVRLVDRLPCFDG